MKNKSVAKIDSVKMNKIFELLYKTNFAKLKSKYNCGATCNPTGFLKISYGKLRSKQIEDYGMEGTFGLYLLFNELRSLVYNLEWETI